MLGMSPNWGKGMRPPLFFDSVKETLQRGFSCRCAAIHLQSPPQRWKRNRFCVQSLPCGQVWTSTRVVVTGAVGSWELVPGALRPWEQRTAPPHLGEWKLLSYGGRRKGPASGPARSASLRVARARQGSGTRKETLADSPTTPKASRKCQHAAAGAPGSACVRRTR